MSLKSVKLLFFFVVVTLKETCRKTAFAEMEKLVMFVKWLKRGKLKKIKGLN